MNVGDLVWGRAAAAQNWRRGCPDWNNDSTAAFNVLMCLAFAQSCLHCVKVTGLRSFWVEARPLCCFCSACELRHKSASRHSCPMQSDQ